MIVSSNFRIRQGASSPRHFREEDEDDDDDEAPETPEAKGKKNLYLEPTSIFVSNSIM
jgi:hypothetical protein